MRLRRDIPFASHDGVTLFGDLYAPDSVGAHPVLVAVPGGGWLRGDRGQLAHWGKRLSECGVAVFAIDYRRSTNGRVFPENAQDVFAATRFVAGEAAALGLDRTRMGLLGASAGAHLAALSALAGSAPFLAGSYPEDAHAAVRPEFRVLVGVYGVYDLPEHWRASQQSEAVPPDDLTERMMGAAYPEARQNYLDASPVQHVAGTDPALKVMLIWGDQDTTVAPAQSVQFARILSSAGCGVTTLPVSGAEHYWFSKDTDTWSGFNGQVAPDLIVFLRRNLVAA